LKAISTLWRKVFVAPVKDVEEASRFVLFWAPPVRGAPRRRSVSTDKSGQQAQPRSGVVFGLAVVWQDWHCGEEKGRWER
jgi:hypothetical protein